MQSSKILNVNIDTIFNFLLDSVIYDIKVNTGTNLSKSEIYSGYSYSKNMTTKTKNTGNITVVIEDLKKPYLYTCKFISLQGTNYIQYKIDKISDNKSKVTYSEWFLGKNKLTNLNFKIFSIFYKKKFQKKSDLIYKSIENHINKGNL